MRREENTHRRGRQFAEAHVVARADEIPQDVLWRDATLELDGAAITGEPARDIKHHRLTRVADDGDDAVRIDGRHRHHIESGAKHRDRGRCGALLRPPSAKGNDRQ